MCKKIFSIVFSILLSIQKWRFLKKDHTLRSFFQIPIAQCHLGASNGSKPVKIFKPERWQLWWNFCSAVVSERDLKSISFATDLKNSFCVAGNFSLCSDLIIFSEGSEQKNLVGEIGKENFELFRVSKQKLNKKIYSSSNTTWNNPNTTTTTTRTQPEKIANAFFKNNVAVHIQMFR